MGDRYQDSKTVKSILAEIKKTAESEQRALDKGMSVFGRDLMLQGYIAELEAELERYRKGFQGSCYACEGVAEKNVELERENAKLRQLVEDALETDNEFQTDWDKAAKAVLKDSGDTAGGE